MWPRTRAYQKRRISIPAKNNQHVDIAIIGAGIAGIAAAYYLCVENKRRSVLLIDSRQPMSYTSAQSGDNYRNWWPHPTMAAFTNDSIDELDRLARDSGNVFNMTRGGYALATRNDDVSAVLDEVAVGAAVDVVAGRAAVQKRFPMFAPDISNVIHIVRGGDISGQQLGQYMLERFRATGGRRVQGQVVEISKGHGYTIDIADDSLIVADIVVNAAGPFVSHIARMLDSDLPVRNVYQQKIAFEDRLAAIVREMPFSIDIDAKHLGWRDDEAALLRDDDELAWLTDAFPGGTHCRPEGRNWVKLGWAYNQEPSEPQDDLAHEPAKDEHFPEIVLRGAAAFLPALTPYVESPPSRFSHYGGYYTMTEENWPLIGPLDNDGAFVVGALSGFGSMSACAAGKLCAAHICATGLPDYAQDLSLARYQNADFMAQLTAANNKGLL